MVIIAFVVKRSPDVSANDVHDLMAKNIIQFMPIQLIKKIRREIDAPCVDLFSTW